MNILLIGKNSMVAKSFINQYGAIHDISLIGREDSIKQYEGDHFDAIIYLAQSSEYKSRIFTSNIYTVNIDLLFRILNTITTSRFIYFSTGSVYKTNESESYYESNVLHTEAPSPYIASKISGEIILNAYKESISSIVILRPFYIYGKEQKPNMLFQSIYDKLITGKTINISGDAGLIFNPVFSDDVANLIEVLLNSSTPVNAIYNVAGKEIVSLKDVVYMLAGILKVEPLISNDNTSKTSVSIGEVNIPNWQPKTFLLEGLTKTYAL